jgi:hypothetical protein
MDMKNPFYLVRHTTMFISFTLYCAGDITALLHSFTAAKLGFTSTLPVSAVTTIHRSAVTGHGAAPLPCWVVFVGLSSDEVTAGFHFRPGITAAASAQCWIR